MTERIDIANAALARIGEDRLSSIEDETKAAYAVKDNYTIVRNQLLMAYNWSFATKRFQPGLLADAPSHGYAYAFKIPSDIDHIVSVSDRADGDVNENRAATPDWEREGNTILSNSNPIYCRGIRFIDDEGAYSSLFTDMFVARLAMVLSVPLAASSTMRRELGAEYAALQIQAKRRDAMQGSSKRIRNRRMQSARRGFSDH